jgi:lipopolysaccharide/colanic/teichoic acid biosynthesis glycosyltransferase
VGRYANEFGLLKFATMLKDSPNIGAGEITIHNDPRVLPIGKILRKTKLNELPQLFNIIKGDMSIVGPRPMVPNTYAKYAKEAQIILNTIRPGLTGIGSIFFRDEEQFLIGKDDPMAFYGEHIIPYKSDLEVWYVKNNSITLYAQIILITAWVVIFSKSKIAEKIFNEIPKRPKVLL